MNTQHISNWLRIGLLAVALLVLSAGTAFADPPTDDAERKAFFGNVVKVDGDIIVVGSKGETFEVYLGEDTNLIIKGRRSGGAPIVQSGDRVAVTVTKEGDILLASSIMVIPQRVTTVHIVGVVAEESDSGVTIISNDGEHVEVELPPNQAFPETGTIVTVVGNLDPSTGVVQVRSLHQLSDTLERLSRHLDDIEHEVPDDGAQVKHLTRIRHLLNKTGERQLEILNRVIDKFPEEARPGLQRAVQNLEEANKGVVRAFSKALGKAETLDEDYKPEPGDSPEFQLPADVEPTLEDVAQALDIGEDDLKELSRQGKTVGEIARDLGVSNKQYVENVQSQLRQKLVRLVEQGRLEARDVKRITQALREKVSSDVDQTLEVEEDEYTTPGIPFSAKDLAKVLGLDLSELEDAFRQGKSLLQIAEAVGLTQSSLGDAIMELARERAQLLLERGHVAEDELDELLAQFREEVSSHISDTPELQARHERADESDDLPVTPNDLAHLLNIPVKEILSHFDGGGTLEQLARRGDMPVELVIRKMVLLAQQRLAHLVEDGQISKDEMQQRLGKLELAIREEQDRDPRKRPAPSATPSTPSLEVDAPFNLTTVARTLGVSPEELRGLLVEGFSLAEIADKYDVSLDELARELLEPVQARMANIRKSGRFIEEQAKRMLQQMTEDTIRALREFRLPQYVEREAVLVERFEPFNTSITTIITFITQVLDVDPQVVARRVNADGSLLPLLRERGIDPKEFANKLLALTKERLRDSSYTDEAISSDKLERRIEEFARAIRQVVFAHAEEYVDPSERPFENIPITLADIARGLNLDVSDLLQRAGADGSLLPILRERGIDPEGFAEELIGQARDRLRDLSNTDRPISPERLELNLEKFARSLKQTIFGETAEYVDPSERPFLDVPVTLADIARILGVDVQALVRRASAEGSLLPLIRDRRIDPRDFTRELVALAKRRLSDGSSTGEFIHPEKLEHLLEEFALTVNQTIFGHTDEAPPSDDVVVVKYVDPATILPRLDNATDVFHALGLGEKVAELRAQGLNLAHIARELGLGHDRLYDNLVGTAEERLEVAVRSDSLHPEQAEDLLAHFRRLAKEWVKVIFADVERASSSDLRHVDPATVLPRLASAGDVFSILGVGEKAAELRKRGLGLAHVARELDLGPDRMHLRLLDIAENVIGSAVRSGSLDSEQAEGLFDDFNHLALEWVEAIFADVEQEPEPYEVTGVDLASILPHLESADDVFHALGIGEKAAELRKRGLSVAQVARELGFGADLVYLRLLDIAEERVAAAIRSDLLHPEKAADLLDNFRRLAEEWAEVIFADVEREPITGVITVSPAVTLPQLGSADDIFHLLGLKEKAAVLQERGLGLAHVARELGYDADMMHIRLLDIAEEIVGSALRSSSLTSPQATELFDDFNRLALEWVEVIFANVTEQPVIIEETTAIDGTTGTEDGSSSTEPGTPSDTTSSGNTGSTTSDTDAGSVSGATQTDSGATGGSTSSTAEPS